MCIKSHYIPRKCIRGWYKIYYSKIDIYYSTDMSVSSRVNACLNSTSTVHACKVLVELHIIYDLNEVMPQEKSIGPSQQFEARSCWRSCWTKRRKIGCRTSLHSCGRCNSSTETRRDQSQVPEKRPRTRRHDKGQEVSHSLALSSAQVWFLLGWSSSEWLESVSGRRSRPTVAVFVLGRRQRSGLGPTGHEQATRSKETVVLLYCS